MSLKGKSKIYKAWGDTRKSKYLLIPSKIAADSQFPFQKDVEEVTIEVDIENRRLIVKKE